MKSFRTWFFSDNLNRTGFTLIEMLVVASIVAFLSVALISEFSRSRVDLDQSVNLAEATVRSAQAEAVASLHYNGYNPCGYGIHWDSTSKQLEVYVGPDASIINCASINKNFQAGQDSVVSYLKISDQKVEIKSVSADIFFVPPDPKTYINDNDSLVGSPATITLGVVGTNCPTDCKTIYVYPSGKIEVQ